MALETPPALILPPLLPSDGDITAEPLGWDPTKRFAIAFGIAYLPTSGETLNNALSITKSWQSSLNYAAPAITETEMANDDITRAEINAKLEAVEARLETKVTRIEAAVESISKSVELAASDMKEFRSETKSEFRSLRSEVQEVGRHKWTLTFTAIATIVATTALTAAVVGLIIKFTFFAHSIPVPH